MKVSDNERFRIFLGSIKITQKEFAAKLGVSKTNINDWVKDRRNITGDMQKRILRLYPELDARWFLFGDGEVKFSTGLVAEPIIGYKQLNLNEMSTLLNELTNQLKQKDGQINFLQSQINRMIGEDEGGGG
jgi:transcriptional regulator with XRE-family HTH domain